MKIMLQVSGQEMSFSEEELITILEKYFESKTTEKKRMEKTLPKENPRIGLRFCDGYIPTRGEPMPILGYDSDF
ncbi:MAG: hypothetical protein IKT41_02380 [Clostridia bacterium]|nr:hypothetical protein [Clostridia bacterium]